MKLFFKYYGGKWRSSGNKYAHPKHDTIVEPFAGSAGYSLRHYTGQRVVLCDVDEIVCGVWQYLIAVGQEEILAIPDVPLDGSVDDLAISQEARWLVGFWLNSGTSGPRKTPSSWMRSGIRPGSFWGIRARQTIADQLDMIRAWEIHQCSYEDAPVSTKATWFIDPPYQIAGQHYRHGSKAIDYGQLAVWCKSRRGQTIVCENGRAEWLPFTSIGSTKTTRRAKRSEEAVWVNDQ